ncbi:MAG TPA: TadE/TadG family type IV pilus assembly protein [Caulobacteraceae bacterium]
MRLFKRGWDSGAAALEAALILPVLLTFIFGALNVGWALYCGAEVRHAVERSTRLLIADPTTSVSAIQTAVDDRLQAADPADVDLTMAQETVGTSGQIARLSWTYAYTVAMPFVDDFTLHFDSSLIVPLRS